MKTKYFKDSDKYFKWHESNKDKIHIKKIYVLSKNKYFIKVEYEEK